MDSKYYGLIEMAVSFGVVAVFVIHQFWTLRDKPPRDDEPPRSP